jgi:hypothetical protein
LYAEQLSTLPSADVDAVIEQLSNEAPGRYEPTFPNWPTLKSMVNDRGHEFSHLRTLVRKLAKRFGEQVDELMLEQYQIAAGRRIDEDLDKAYATILRSDQFKRMPTPGEFLWTCGMPATRLRGEKKG